MSKQTPKQLGMDLNDWEFYKKRNPRPLDGCIVSDFHASFFKKEFEQDLFTMGRFFLGEIEVYRAWGLASEVHCSYNSIRLHDGSLSRPIIGCPDVSLEIKERGVGAIVIKSPLETVVHHVTIKKKS